MIYTTYFANLKNLDHETSCPIAICGKSPDGYNGLEYKKLAPKWWFFKQWKETHDNDFYIENFNKEVLSVTSPQKVMMDIRNLIAFVYGVDRVDYSERWWENVPYDIYLVCYEKPGDFCHRYLVADWFTANGIEVKEASV